MKATSALLGGVLLGASACNWVAGIGEPSDRLEAGSFEGSSDYGRRADPEDGSNDVSSSNEGASAVDGSIGVDASVPVDAPSDRSLDAETDRADDAHEDRPIVVPPADAGSTTVRFHVEWSDIWNARQIDVRTPDFVAEHDFMWLSLFTDLRSTTLVTVPPGWTLKGERSNVTVDIYARWFYKFATANEPSLQTFTFNQSTRIFAGIAAYSGVDPNSPFDSGIVTDTHLSPCVAPSIQPVSGSGLLFVASFLHDTATMWMPAPIGSITERTFKQGLWVGDFPQVSAGATDAKSVTCTPAGEGAVSVIALRPAPSP